MTSPGDTSGSATADIGGVRTPVIGGQFVSALNEVSRAWFSVEMSAGLAIEYLAPVTVDIDGHVMIQGAVVAAYPYGDRVEIHVQSAVALTEETMPGWLLQNLRTQDAVYAAARMSGFDRDHVVIDDLGGVPPEVFEVVVGIDGISPTQPACFGPVTFVSPVEARRILQQFDPPPEWAPEFEEAPGYAVVYLTADQMYDAQEEALADVDVALSWLVTRARYGHSRLPDGTLYQFDRDESHGAPRRRDLVALRGLSTTRRWIHRLGPRVRGTALRIGGRSRLGDPTFPRNAPSQLKQAMLSAQRAIETGDPIQRSQALWEAIESYLAGRPTEHLFSSAERGGLLKAMRSAVSQDHHQRVADLLNWIDRPPPKAALRLALDDDGIPVTDVEFELLFKLRMARNRATHGGRAEVPANEDLDYACSILSRIIVFWVGKLASA